MLIKLSLGNNHLVNILGSIDEKIENNEQKILKLEKFLLDEFSKFSSNISDFESKKAEEVFNISIGRTPPRQEFQWFEEAKNNNNKKWISIADMGSSNVFIFNTNEYLTNDAITKFNIPLIKPNTVILSFKLTVGRVNITSEEMLSNEAIAHFNTDNKFLLPYTYCYLKSFNYNNLGSTSSKVKFNSEFIMLFIFVILKSKYCNTLTISVIWRIWFFKRMETCISFVLTNVARITASSLDVEPDSLVLLPILLLCLSPR